MTNGIKRCEFLSGKRRSDIYRASPPFGGVGPIPCIPFTVGEGEYKYKNVIPSLTPFQEY
jgi:hypothetical protein